jgi:ABC-type transport system substrate-binding protein
MIVNRGSLILLSCCLLTGSTALAQLKDARLAEPLASLDPVWTSAMTTRNVGFMIYDVLFGRDAAMNPKPQMLEGYLVEDDGKRWVMTLRENQWFHDGTKVLARDCTASLRRWMKRDPGGATLEARLDALEAQDDRRRPRPHAQRLRGDRGATRDSRRGQPRGRETAQAAS